VAASVVLHNWSTWNTGCIWCVMYVRDWSFSMWHVFTFTDCYDGCDTLAVFYVIDVTHLLFFCV